MFEISSYAVKLVKQSRKKYTVDGVGCPDDAAEILAKYLKGTDRENFVVLMLDIKNKVLGINTVSVGSLTATVVHPREVFKPAILMNAAGIILGHNHPSGDVGPSKEDIATTKKMVEAGKLLDIPVLDHVIVGDGFTSLREEGWVR